MVPLLVFNALFIALQNLLKIPTVFICVTSKHGMDRKIRQLNPSYIEVFVFYQSATVLRTYLSKPNCRFPHSSLIAMIYASVCRHVLVEHVKSVHTGKMDTHNLLLQTDCNALTHLVRTKPRQHRECSLCIFTAFWLKFLIPTLSPLMKIWTIAVSVQK